jgi:hypothetical protein
MSMALARPLPPRAPQFGSLSAWTWIDSTPDGLVSFALVTPGAGGPTAAEMQTLAEDAGFATPDQPLPSPGIRLVLQGPDAVIALPGAEHGLRIPADAGWADFVRRGGTVVVALGAQSLAAGADRVAVEAYILESLLPRRIWMGKTTLAAEYTAVQLRGEACVCCGRKEGPLVPAGHAYTPTSGAPLGWPVVACPAHAPEETAR